MKLQVINYIMQYTALKVGFLTSFISKEFLLNLIDEERLETAIESISLTVTDTVAPTMENLTLIKVTNSTKNYCTTCGKECNKADKCNDCSQYVSNVY